MHINLEASEKYSVQAYSDHEIKVDFTHYQDSLIISSKEIIANWNVSSIQELDIAHFKPLLQLKPKIIIIGHNQQGKYIPPLVLQELSKLCIGIESMSIGAACRTFNVLLSEKREVVLGIIF